MYVTCTLQNLRKLLTYLCADMLGTTVAGRQQLSANDKSDTTHYDYTVI